MESPEGNRYEAPSSSTPASSPAVQESPFFNYLSNLSPIKSVKASRYTIRFSDNQFPTPPQVFRTPKLDLQRESSFLKSGVVSAKTDDVYGDSCNRLKTILIPCSQKEVQPCTPSGCVDEYLTDPLEEGCTNSDGEHVQPANNVPKLLQYGHTAPLITSTKVNDANNKNSEDFMLMLRDQAEVDPLRSLVLSENAIEQEAAESFNGSLELTPKRGTDQVESSTQFLSSSQHYEHYVAQLQNAGLQHNGQDGSSQSPKSLQNVEAFKDCTDSFGLVSKGSFKESNLYQRGIRRHLQFEAAMASKSATICKSHSSHKFTQEAENSMLPASLADDLERLVSSDVESREVSSGRETACGSKNIASRPSFCQSELMRANQHGGSLVISGPIDSDMGMPLNSMTGSVSISSEFIPSKNFLGYMCSQEDNFNLEGSNHLAKDSNSCLISDVAGKFHTHADNNQQDNQAVAGTISSASRYTDSMKLLCESLHMTLCEQQTASCDGRMLTSQNNDRIEELNQASPKKKRKKAANNIENEGCKRCNCRRSKCLKLYCECFAAGVYCINSCACENCFNKREYEETVNDTRQQIESRNPLAFAPKIVNHAAESPANVVEDGNWKTPASARHKRGCNCKKSKCLKKYCECFQANVGCSDGCRCEGCSNSFGKKTESKYRNERWENPSHVKRDAPESVTGCSKTETMKQFSPRWEEIPDKSHLTPLAHPCSGAEASSASPYMRHCPKVPGPLLHRRSSFKSSAFQPQRHSSDSEVRDIMKEDDVPETLKDASTPTKAIKVSSPNKKRVSPPQYRSQELRSSSPGLRSARKFILQTMPSFPPLTPYSKTKGGIGRTESKFEGDGIDH